MWRTLPINLLLLTRLAKLLSVERTVDTVVWQMLASVIIPGYAIHTLVAALHAGLLSVESSQALLDAIDSAAPVLSTSPAVMPPYRSPLTGWSR